jgi:ABC-type cobalamin/Fe3+-siderophores transport system ATPase subunit
MSALLALREVGLHYERGGRHVIPVLENASLELWPGEVVCVQAQRGRGKTALLRVAAGMEQPTAGCVWIAGEDVWGMSDRRRSRLLGCTVSWVAGAQPELDVPALDHIAMGLTIRLGTRAGYRRAHEALERVGIHDCAQQHWSELSDFERSLLVLARVFARRSQLLFVDDLTVMLRGEESEEVGRLLASLAHDEGVGVLASVSGVRETVWSDRVALLSCGELMLPTPEPKPRLGKVVDFPGPRGSGGSEKAQSERRRSGRDSVHGVPA